MTRLVGLARPPSHKLVCVHHRSWATIGVMSAIQIAGCSGAGKSTVAAVLARSGLAAIDSDDDPFLARFVDPTGAVVAEAPATGLRRVRQPSAAESRPGLELPLVAHGLSREIRSTHGVASRSLVQFASHLSRTGRSPRGLHAT
jgi:hypothetical protein